MNSFLRLFLSPPPTVGVDFGFAFYRRFVSDEAGLKVRKHTRPYTRFYICCSVGDTYW